MDNFVLKIAQISDLHISKHRNLLEPMIDSINREDLDLVVVTGDTVHEPTKELFDKAYEGLNKINCRVVAIPGDYDCDLLWNEYFGDSYKYLDMKGYCLDFIDTSFMGHRFFHGWEKFMTEESPEQSKWLKERLKDDKYHFIFSHHPAFLRYKEYSKDNNGELLEIEETHEFLSDIVRVNYCGHSHEPLKMNFKYAKPKKDFGFGFVTTLQRFHGNSCYSLILIKDNAEIIHVPRMVDVKFTAW